MKQFKFKKIDAFATQTSGGNPAGAIYLDSQKDITEKEMLAIARALKGFVSEVGYIWPLEHDTFGIRYYSSEREVDFCGHATIAIFYDLIQTGKDLLKQKQVEIITNKGKLSIENRIESENAVFITAPDPVFSEKQIDRYQVANALRIKHDEIETKEAVSIVNAGLETLIVPLKSLNGIISLSPVLDELKAFCIQNSVDIITVFTEETADKKNRFRTRVFAPTFGYLEDPATGSGNAALGYFLIKSKKWEGSLMSLEQNGSLDTPNVIKLKTKENQTKRQVAFGGGAITRIDGNYLLW